MKRINPYFYLPILAFLALTNCCFAQSVGNPAYEATLKTLLDHSVPEIGVQEAQKKKNVVFVDAREKAEFETSHIDGAVWVGYDDFDVFRMSEIPLNSEVIVYCSVGYRSEKVSEKLLKAGDTNVHNLYGGIFEWANQELPLYKKAKATDKVHAYNRTWGVWLEKGEKVYK